MQKNILITGRPKSGKSTLLRKLIAAIPNKVGFVTNEILGAHGRVGFEMETHTGRRAVLAQVDFKTEYRVAKYFVNVDALRSLLPDVSRFGSNAFLYIDEIGQMQLFSDACKELVLRYLNSPNTCVATLSYVFENEFTKELKERGDVILVELSVENREEKEKFLAQLLTKIEKAKRYSAEPERFKRDGSQAELRSEHGIRRLEFTGDAWKCTCDFFARYGMCSHAIATKELAKSTGT